MPQRHNVSIGIRIEVPYQNKAVELMASHGVLDPKFIKQPRPGVEFRTFCFCKRGSVIQSCVNGLYTYSGTSDRGETEFTNFGLMARTTKQDNGFSQKDVDEYCIREFSISMESLTFDDFCNLFLKKCPGK